MFATPTLPVRFALAGTIAMAAAMGIGRFVYTPLLPGMMDALGLSASDAGLIASSNYLGYLIGALLAAGNWPTGRERLLMMAALAANALLAGAMGLTDAFAAVLAIRFAAGIASAFAMIFTVSIVFSHLAAARRTDLQAVLFAGVGVGIAVSSLMLLALIAWQPQWQAGWFWSAGLSAAACAAVAMMIDRGPIAQAGQRAEPPMPRTRPLVRVIIAYALFGMGYVVTATFLVAIIRASEGSHQFEALVWLVTGLTVVPSVFVWNRLARRVGVTRTYAIGCAVEAVGVTASVAIGGSIGPLLAGMLLGGTFVAITAFGLQAARLMAPLSPRRVLALMTAAFGVGQILGPILAGIVAQRAGSFVLPSLGAAVVLLLSGWSAWSAGPAPKAA